MPWAPTATLVTRSQMTDATQHSQGILRTKLHRPPVSSGLVVRGRLLESMGTGSSPFLTLVSAPAGYGKSVMVSQWAESQAPTISAPW